MNVCFFFIILLYYASLYIIFITCFNIGGIKLKGSFTNRQQQQEKKGQTVASSIKGSSVFIYVLMGLKKQFQQSFFFIILIAVYYCKELQTPVFVPEPNTSSALESRKYPIYYLYCSHNLK